MTISHRMLEILVCPRCKGPVRAEEAPDRLVCEACRLAFPVLDDIPVMLVDEASSLDAPPAEKKVPSSD